MTIEEHAIDADISSEFDQLTRAGLKTIGSLSSVNGHEKITDLFLQFIVDLESAAHSKVNENAFNLLEHQTFVELGTVLG